MSLERNIMGYCELAGISLDELAERAGLAKYSIINWFAGKASPKLESLDRVAEALHCDTTNLIAGRQTDSAQGGTAWRIIAEMTDVINELEEENRFLRHQLEKEKAKPGYLF